MALGVCALGRVAAAGCQMVVAAVVVVTALLLAVRHWVSLAPHSLAAACQTSLAAAMGPPG